MHFARWREREDNGLYTNCQSSSACGYNPLSLGMGGFYTHYLSLFMLPHPRIHTQHHFCFWIQISLSTTSMKSSFITTHHVPHLLNPIPISYIDSMSPSKNYYRHYQNALFKLASLTMKRPRVTYTKQVIHITVLNNHAWNVVLKFVLKVFFITSNNLWSH